MVTCCRPTSKTLPPAAGFVSGYLIQLTADLKPLEGPEGPTADFTDLHAWTEVFLPGAGWVGLDPTSGLLTGEGHIPLAATPSPQTAAPISGGVEKSEVEFSVEMTVTRIHEDPRVTKPYTEEAWQRIDAVGAEVDRRLQADDVRLTIDPEPSVCSRRIDSFRNPVYLFSFNEGYQQLTVNVTSVVTVTEVPQAGLQFGLPWD